MTTIASFGTIQAPDNNKSGKKLTAVYLLTDSQISTVANGNINVIRNNVQKVFFNEDCKIIFGYYGDSVAGSSILNSALNSIHANASIRLASNSIQKNNAIKLHFEQAIKNLGTNILRASLTIVCVSVIDSSFNLFTLSIKPGETQFILADQPIFAQTFIYVGGSGEEAFKKFYEEKTTEFKGENEAAVFFRSFCEFLLEKKDPLSSLPCQGVLIDSDGKIKQLSIKHKDDFYLLGNPHLAENRANFNSEIDYRDFHFEFLHHIGKIRGDDRKKYFRGEEKNN